MHSHDDAAGTVRSHKKLSIPDLIVTVLLTALQLALGWGLRFLLIILSMRSTGCTPLELCNTGLAAAAINAMPSVVGASVILTIVLSTVFARRGRPLWHAGVFGLAFITVAFVIAAGLNYWALTPSAG
jgi:hypothetical protein